MEPRLAPAAGVQPREELASVAPEDALRARIYDLLAVLLSGPPDDDLMRQLATLSGDASPLGRAISGLARSAGATTSGEAAEAYQDLFIGLGRGELVPFGSYYLTGFLNEKPLARLRDDMARLGIGRATTTSDPEDHIASVLEMMAGLITGRFDGPASLADQATFFGTHVGSWAAHFFADLAGSTRSTFYSDVGRVGGAFIHVEEESFRYA